jgi:beta-fructofuranosidase
MALTYTSDDLHRWEYDGVALSRNTSQTSPVWMGALWECPQIFPVGASDGSKWAMVSSVWDVDVLHYAGDGLGDGGSYTAGRFAPSRWGRLSFGGSYYAPTFFRDADGRPCLMFWMRGVADATAGWASCLSIPYVVSVADGRLALEPHPALAARRGDRLEAGVPAAAFEVAWTPRAEGDAITLEGIAAETAKTRVTDGAVVLDRRGADEWSMPWSPGDRVRIIVDGPVVEVSSMRGILGGPIEPALSWQSPDKTATGWTLH